jgi:hypothetical protein
MIKKMKLLKKIFIIFYILLSLIVFTIFLLSSYEGNSLNINLYLKSEDCETVTVTSDVINPMGFFTKSSRAKIIKNDYTRLEFPISSKVLKISFCPKSQVQINDIQLEKENKNIQIKPNKLHWVCKDCEISIFDKGIKFNLDSDDVSTNNISRYYPPEWRYHYLFFRYIPYLIFTGYFFIFTLLVFNSKLIFYELLVYSSLILISFIKKLNDIKNIFPPAEIRQERVIGSVHYSGKSIVADYYVVLIFILLPIVTYTLLKLRNKYLYKLSLNKRIFISTVVLTLILLGIFSI